MYPLRSACVTLLLSISIGLSFALNAQRSGDIEIGGIGSFTRYDPTLAYENTIGGGGRLSFFFIPHLALEAEVLFTETVDPNLQVLTHVAVRGRMLFDINPMPWGLMHRLHFLLGAGAAHNEYRLQSRGADMGASALGGLRMTLAQPLSLRMEAVADYVPETVLLAETPTNVLNWTFQVVLSLHLRFRGGNSRPERGTGGTG